MAKVGEVLIQLILRTKEANDDMEKTTKDINRGLSLVDKKAQETGGIINKAFRAATSPMRTMFRTTNLLTRSFSRMSGAFKREGESMLETGQELTVALAGPFLAIGAAAVYAFSQTKEGAKVIDRLVQSFKNALSVMAPMGEWLVRFAFELLPPLTSALRAINNWFMSLSEEQRRWVTFLALALTAVGPLITVLGAYAYLLGLLGKFLAGLLSPTALFVYGILAIGAALVYAYNKVAWFRDLVNGTWQQIRAIFEQTWNGLVARFQAHLGSIIAWWNAHKAQVIPIVTGIWNFISTIVVGALRLLSTIILGVLDFIASLWQKHGTELWNTIQTAYYFIRGVITRTLLAIQGWWQQHGESIWTSVVNAYNLIKNTISTIISGVLSFIQWVLTTIGAWWSQHGQQVVTTVLNFMTWLWTGIIQPTLTDVVNFIGQMLNKIKTWWDQHGANVTAAVQKIMSFISAAFNVIMQIIKVAMEFIWPIVESTWESIKNLISGALDVILGLVGIFSALLTGDWEALWDSIKQFLSGALKVLLSLLDLYLLGKILKLFKLLGSRAFSFVSNGWNRILSAVKSFGSKIWNSVKSTFKNIDNTIDSIINGIVNAAARWGRNLINNFISGITSMFGKLRSVVSKGVSIVKDFLGFSSPTKKGPGREADEWPVNLIKTFSTGMETKLPDLRRAALNVAQTISIVSEPVSATASATATPPTFNGPLVQIQQAVIRNEEDIRRLAEQVSQELRRIWDDYNAARGL